MIDSFQCITILSSSDLPFRRGGSGVVEVVKLKLEEMYIKFRVDCVLNILFKG